MVLPKLRASTSLTDLDKVKHQEQISQFVHQQPIYPQEEYYEKRPYTERYFDSSGHRICAGLLHVKIGTYVFCTLVLQEIVGGIIFLLTRDEIRQGNVSARIVVLMLCRLAQLPPTAILYGGLYQCKRFYLLPFALCQVTLGPFVDISTFIMILEDAEPDNLFFNKFTWLNIVIPLILYMVLLIALMFVLYRCFVYFREYTAHNNKYCDDRSTALPLCRGNDISEVSASWNRTSGKADTQLSSAM
uniref:Uncharacterized protein n=1 Tax=Panagrellus redivivus TaxID=6233 RepID=A0A7E4VSH6_PANRE